MMAGTGVLSWRQLRASTGAFLTSLFLSALMIAALALAFRFLAWPWLARELGADGGLWLKRLGTAGFALIGYGLYVRVYERRWPGELRPHGRDILVGVASGVLPVAGCIFLLNLLGVYRFRSIHGFDDVGAILGLIFLVAMLEELIFRVVLLRLLTKHYGTRIALIVQVLLFSGLHLVNAGEPGLILLAGIFLGLTWSLLFLRSGNLWLPSFNHASWNASIALSGLPLSGVRDWIGQAPLEASIQGPSWLSGGRFGPEASVVTILLVAVSVAVLWQKQEPVKP